MGRGSGNSSPSLRSAGLSVLVLMVVSSVLFFVAPGPPDAPASSEIENEIQQRKANWAVRDALRWQAEQGDFVVPWEQATGHLAIVIDDVGRELRHQGALQALRYPLTFSILPGAIYADGVQQRLGADLRRPREILLHLPMEPKDRGQMSLGAEAQEDFLRVDDSSERLVRKTRVALDAVPMAVGVNNHMGSRLTEDARAMMAIMPIFAERGLFFLDSRTSVGTVAETSARRAGVPSLARHVFLDNETTPSAIRKMLNLAVERSKTEPVVAIGHPSAALVDVLVSQLPELHAAGIGIYAVSELLRRQTRAKMRANDAQ